MTADVVIRGGTVIDGTGSAGRLADVAVTDGIITEIGPGLTGRRELDASGRIVAPGFGAIHTHYDAQVFRDPPLSPRCWHGVAPVGAGNRGVSSAPVRRRDRVLPTRDPLSHGSQLARGSRAGSSSREMLCGAAMTSR